MSNPAVGGWVDAWLSAPRFAVYVVATDGDRARTLELYEWNSAISAAFLHDLAHLEVGLRNAYDRALTDAMPTGSRHWVFLPHHYIPPMVRAARNGQPYHANERMREQHRQADG